jgi:hypothetical protein
MEEMKEYAKNCECSCTRCNHKEKMGYIGVLCSHCKSECYKSNRFYIENYKKSEEEVNKMFGLKSHYYPTTFGGIDLKGNSTNFKK